MDLTEARIRLSEAINTLADPCDACDFNDSEAEALLQTINDALRHLKKLAEMFDAELTYPLRTQKGPPHP